MARYLLSTDAFIALVRRRQNHPVAQWANSLDWAQHEIYLSVISIGTVRASIEVLPPDNPKKATWETHFRGALRAFPPQRILEVSMKSGFRWGALIPLDLEWINQDTGVQERLPDVERQIVAQALADDIGLALVEKRQPYHIALAVQGLIIEDPWT